MKVYVVTKTTWGEFGDPDRFSAAAVFTDEKAAHKFADSLKETLDYTLNPDRPHHPYDADVVEFELQ